MAGAPFVEMSYSSPAQRNGWRGRLREASYKAPNGKLIKFNYEEVSRKFEARGTIHEFPGLNQAYVQRTGIGSRKYPIRAYFNGPTCDVEAGYFEWALTMDGLGELNHPMYGTGLQVVPFGEVERRDDLVKQSNQVIVDVTFWTTTGVPYPFSGVDAKNEIREAAYNVDIEATQAFNNRFVAFPEELRGPMNGKTFADWLKNIEQTMMGAYNAIADKRRQMQDGINLINRTMDVLVGMPIMLAQQVLGLMKAPGEAFEAISDRLDCYKSMVDGIITDTMAQPAKTLASAHALAIKPIQLANGFHSADLIVTGALNGLLLSTLDYEYKSKQEALDTAAELEAQFAKVNGWRDEQFAALSNPSVGLKSLSASVDAGETFQKLYLARTQTMARLVEMSFSLYAERAIILDRPRSFIDLCAELYGDISLEKLNYFINTNNLGGDEFVEIPEGRRIVYYAPRG
jgi:hypothetical protein